MDFHLRQRSATTSRPSSGANLHGKGATTTAGPSAITRPQAPHRGSAHRFPASGRRLTVDSDQPGVQVYTGNWLAGSPLNKAGRPYEDYDGVAIECQDFPDAPNRETFPEHFPASGEEYLRRINFKFSTI